jgi:hypothetical protein
MLVRRSRCKRRSPDDKIATVTRGGITMNRKIFLSAIAITILGSATILAQGQQQLPPAMSFFVAPNPTGAGNLGGIAGADQICQNAAQASGGLNFNHTWHAYLSQEQRGTTPRWMRAIALVPDPGTTPKLS